MKQENKTPGIDWQRGAAAVICLAAAIGVVWLLFRYALGIALPFLLAWLLAQLIKPLVGKLCNGRRLPRGPVAGVLVVLLAGGTVYLAIRGIQRGIDELGRLIAELAADTDGLVSAIGHALERVNSLSAHIPFLRNFEDTPGYADFCARLDGLVETGISRLVENLSARLPDAAMAVAGWLPSALLFVVVMLLSCYYFSADDGHMAASIRQGVLRILPPSWQDALPPLGRRIRRLGRQYFRAYLLLGLLTFLEMFIGLALLRIPYAFILAWVIALVDFLPLLGTGAVLLPWAAVCALMGQAGTAIGLLVLYGVSAIIRQVLEPKLVGRGLGLHPLLSLISMYAGLELFGFAGLLLAPLLVAVVRSVVMPDV